MIIFSLVFGFNMVLILLAKYAVNHSEKIKVEISQNKNEKY